MMPGYGGVFKFHGVDFLREASDKRLNDVRSAYLVNYAGSPLTIVPVEPDLLPTDGPIFLFPPDNEALKAAAECVPRILEELSRPEDLPMPSKISPRKVDFILPSSPHEHYFALEEAFRKLEEETLDEIIAESSRPVIPCSARTFGESDLPRLLKKHVGRAEIEYLDELFTKDDRCLEDIQLLRDNTRFGQKLEGTEDGSLLHVLEDQLLASLPDEEICDFLELAILETQSLPRPPPQRPAEATETFKVKQETYSCSGETQAEIEVSETEVKREPFMNLASAEAVAKVNSTAETLSFPSTPPVSPTTVPTTTQFGSQLGLNFASLEFEYSDSPPPSARDESRDPQQDSAPSEAVVKHELAEFLHSQVECPFETQQKSSNGDGASTDLPYMYQESEIPGDLADTENILTANQGVQQETEMTVPDERECCSSLQIENESQLGSRRAQPSTSKDDSGACRVAVVAPQEVNKSEEELHLATPTDMTPANRALNFSDIFQDTCNNDLDCWSDTEIQIGEDVDCQGPASSDDVPGERLNAAGSSSENGFFSVEPRCSWQTSDVALLPPKRPKLRDEEGSESAMEPITNEAFVQPPGAQNSTPSTHINFRNERNTARSEMFNITLKSSHSCFDSSPPMDMSPSSVTSSCLGDRREASKPAPCSREKKSKYPLVNDLMKSLGTDCRVLESLPSDHSRSVGPKPLSAKLREKMARLTTYHRDVGSTSTEVGRRGTSSPHRLSFSTNPRAINLGNSITKRTQAHKTPVLSRSEKRPRQLFQDNLATCNRITNYFFTKKKYRSEMPDKGILLSGLRKFSFKRSGSGTEPVSSSTPLSVEECNGNSFSRNVGLSASSCRDNAENALSTSLLETQRRFENFRNRRRQEALNIRGRNVGKSSPNHCDMPPSRQRENRPYISEHLSFGGNAVNCQATFPTERQKHRDVDKLQFLDFPADREESQGYVSFGAFQYPQQHHQRNSYGMPVNRSSASDAWRAQGEEELNVLAPRPRQHRSGERNDAVLRLPKLTGTDYSIYSDSEDGPDDTVYLDASDRPQLYPSFDAHYLDMAKQDNIDDSSLFDRRQRVEEGQRWKPYDPRNESTGNCVGTYSEFDSQGGSAGPDQMYHGDSSRMLAMGRRDPRYEASTLRPQVPDRRGESSYYEWNQTFPRDYEDDVGMSDESRDFDQHDQVIDRPHHITGNIPSDDDTVDNVPVQDDSHPHPYRTIRKAIQAPHASDTMSYMNSGKSLTPRYMRQNVYGEPFQQNTARGFNPCEDTPSIAPGYNQSTPKSRYENQSRNYEVPPESVSRDTLDELGDVDEFWNNDPRLAEECTRIAIQRGLVLSSPMARYAKTVWKKAPSAVLKPSEQKEPLSGGLYFQAIREDNLDNSASS